MFPLNNRTLHQRVHGPRQLVCPCACAASISRCVTLRHIGASQNSHKSRDFKNFEFKKLCSSLQFSRLKLHSKWDLFLPIFNHSDALQNVSIYVSIFAVFTMKPNARKINILKVQKHFEVFWKHVKVLLYSSSHSQPFFSQANFPRDTLLWFTFY